MTRPGQSGMSPHGVGRNALRPFAGEPNGSDASVAVPSMLSGPDGQTAPRAHCKGPWYRI